MKKILFILVGISLLATACKTDLPQQNNTINNIKIMKSWDQEQQKAIAISDNELEKHFPGKKNMGIKYEVVNVMGMESPASSLNKLYDVWYTLPNGPTDQSVSIIVDLTAGKIVSFKITKF